jgi:hypothetical protein
MSKQIVIIVISSISLIIQLSYNRAKGQKVSSDNDNCPNISIIKVHEDDFMNAKKTYSDNIIFDSTLSKKTSGVLKLPIENKTKPFVTFTDTIDPPYGIKSREYEYAGELKRTGFYIVDGNFYEYYQCYLVDGNSGNLTTLWQKPYVSPNDKFIADFSSYGIASLPCGFQIWHLDNSAKDSTGSVLITKYFELYEDVYTPLDIVWESDDSFILKIADIESYFRSSVDDTVPKYYYLRVDLKGW